MIIQDAIKSGKRFKRLGEPNWFDIKATGQDNPWLEIKPSHIIADDWIIDEIKELSKEDITEAYNRCFGANGQLSRLLHELGF